MEMTLRLRRWFERVAVAALIGFLLAGCTTVPVTGRQELNFIPADQEMQLGLTSFEQLKKDVPINHDPAINAMVQRVGKRIAAVASRDLPDAKWEFVVFDSKEANAFCLPGGKVGVYTGILPITQNDAGLATVIGHEVGHAVAHHGASRMSEALATQGIGQAAGAYLGTTKYAQYQDLFLSLYGVGSKVGLELPHSRKQESEADHIGLIYMARAGYDPREAVAFWKRFAGYSSRQGATPSFITKFLGTHPLDTQRIQDLEHLLPLAETEYARSPKAP